MLRCLSFQGQNLPLYAETRRSRSHVNPRRKRHQRRGFLQWRDEAREKRMQRQPKCDKTGMERGGEREPEPGAVTSPVPVKLQFTFVIPY